MSNIINNTRRPTITLLSDTLVHYDDHEDVYNVTGTVAIQNVVVVPSVDENDNEKQPVMVAIHLELEVKETTVVSKIPSAHRISYTFQGSETILEQTYDITSNVLKHMKESTHDTATAPFSVALPKTTPNTMIEYRHDDRRNASVLTNGYYQGSKYNGQAERMTYGSCKVRCILKASLKFRDDGGRKESTVHFHGTNLRMEEGVMVPNSLLVASSLSFTVDPAVISLPITAFCGLFTIAQKQTFALKYNNNNTNPPRQYPIVWCPRKQDLHITIIDDDKEQRWSRLAATTIVKLAQRISYAATSDIMIEYKEDRGRRIPPILKPYVNLERPQTLRIEDQSFFWEHTLEDAKQGKVAFPTSSNPFRGSYSGRSIQVDHELFVYTKDQNGELLATSQPIPLVVR